MRDMLWFRNEIPAFRSIVASQPRRWDYKWMRQSPEHRRGDTWQIMVTKWGWGSQTCSCLTSAKFFGGFGMRYAGCCLPQPFVRLGLGLFKIMA